MTFGDDDHDDDKDDIRLSGVLQSTIVPKNCDDTTDVGSSGDNASRTHLVGTKLASPIC